MFNFLLLSLATWRISYMLVLEDGPYNLFALTRYHLGIVDDIEGRYIRDDLNSHLKTLASIFNCVYCMSIWMAFFWSGLLVLSRDAAQLLALPFALSAVTLLIGLWKNG